MRRIEYNGQLYAMKISPNEDAPDIGKTTWFGEDSMSLQGSLMHYERGHNFRMHRHKLNPRIINKTQECFVVVRGEILVSIKKDADSEADCVYVKPGEVMFIWRGFHGLQITADGTLCYEFKAGQWNGFVDDDKEFLN